MSLDRRRTPNSTKTSANPRTVQRNGRTPEALQQAIAAYGAGHLVEAEKLCRAITSVNHDSCVAWQLFAVVHAKLGHPDQAVANYERALTLQPDHAEVLSNCGNNLHKLKRFGEALASYERALALQPCDADGFYHRGNILLELKRFEEACASYERALELKPDHTNAFHNRGLILLASGRFDEALASHDRALALRPDHVETLINRAVALKQLKRFNQALEGYQTVSRLQPAHKYAFGEIADCAMKLCDWKMRDKFAAEMSRQLIEGKSIINPFSMLGYSDDASLQLCSAKSYLRDKIGSLPQPLWRREVWRNEKIKIAYLSADFRRHPLSYLMVELFELHDRSRFEVIGLSLGRDDHSDIRARVAAAFDQFIDVRTKSDEEVARVLNDLHADIAVDLMGHTTGARPRILAFRPAPIQVSYMGFPATTGADFIDYIIADPIVMPLSRQPFFTENIVHLPDCYWVNDRKRKVATRSPTREEFGLPTDGFVFCCFNNNWKITSIVFDVWMRLLREADGSVLWLLGNNKGAESNLRREASTRGVNPGRLVFAGRIDVEDHLKRHCLADLFLDTLPYNAHTTASDALWVGLPVLTCQGNSFAGRVASSLLHAIGLPELVTTDLPQYEALALKLAREPELLREIKSRLSHNRDTHPLFDTDRFRRNIEAAYLQMWDIWQCGARPRQIVLRNIPQA